MNYSEIQTKAELIQGIEDIFNKVSAFIEACNENKLKAAYQEKWTIIQQFDHLIKSAAPVALGLSFPKFLIRLLFGKAKNTNQTYQQLQNKYHKSFEGKPVSPKRYEPKIKHSHTELIKKWNTVKQQLIKRMQVSWSEDSLKQLRMPHPTMGKISVFELLLFTIYHTQFHLESMNEIKQA